MLHKGWHIVLQEFIVLAVENIAKDGDLYLCCKQEPTHIQPVNAPTAFTVTL